MPNANESHVEIHSDKSILVYEDGKTVVFKEGATSASAQARLAHIKDELRAGFLEQRIQNLMAGKVAQVENEAHRELLDGLVNSLTSEVGRALIGLTILQCCVRAIEPHQSIRLHKASSGDANFSWKEGIPMRSIDRELITPVLRKYDLLHLNADGFMMTRALAENYPYTKLYKAAMRGGREEWLSIVKLVEDGSMDASASLDYLLGLLLNKSAEFDKVARACLKAAAGYLKGKPTLQDIQKLISRFVGSTGYSARVFEVAMHSLMQAVSEVVGIDGVLRPLTQMRSANKKHGNIGDVEVLEAPESPMILEAWDAKYGKPYLRDELEELGEKLAAHPEVVLAGMVVDRGLDLRGDIVKRKEELEGLHGVEIELLNFDQWVKRIVKRAGVNGDELGRAWLKAFAESLCQRRREIAPIDEPSYEWVRQLGEELRGT